jgi:hypothetical protein
MDKQKLQLRGEIEYIKDELSELENLRDRKLITLRHNICNKNTKLNIDKCKVALEKLEDIQTKQIKLTLKIKELEKIIGF